MDEDELRRTLRRIIDEEIKPTFLQMLKESEHRIDETNKMIQRLAEMCLTNQDTYDRHISVVENSRDRSQSSNAGLIAANKDLAQQLRLANENHARQSERLLTELGALREDFRKLQDAYMRLAEMQHSGQGQNSSRAEVKVSGIVTPL